MSEATSTSPAVAGPAAGRPRRPSPRVEALASRLFFGLAPRLAKVPLPETPAALAPWERLRLPRHPGSGPGELAATWFPATGEARGAVLFLPPWTEWAQAYFHRRGRIEAVRAAGLHAVAIDLPGSGASGPRRGFPERDVPAALDSLGARWPGLPRHVWGVSAGGYWAHHGLAGAPGAATSAFFEDVSPHLLEWSWHVAPFGRPLYVLFRVLFPSAYRFLDARLHAPHMGVAAVAHVSGADDPGVRPEDTETLARLAGGSALVVPGAGHLAAIRVAGEQVLAKALETFARGAQRRG